jgi:hypothetical protein
MKTKRFVELDAFLMETEVSATICFAREEPDEFVL